MLLLHGMARLQCGGALMEGVRGSCGARMRLEDLVRSLLLLLRLRLLVLCWIEEMLRKLYCCHNGA